MDIDLELQIAEAATAGPWEIGKYFDGREFGVCSPTAETFVVQPNDMQIYEDLLSIAHARTHYPLCLEALKSIRELCEIETDRYGGHAHEAGRASMASDILDLFKSLENS